MPISANYRAATSFEGLSETDGTPFYDRVTAADFPEHVLRFRNDQWATPVGLDGLSNEEWINHFGRFETLPNNLTSPLAIRYHGHQFRSYNPQIGDGRGFLFAQLHDDQSRLLDLGTKGSGQTPYSRSGDGRLTLKGGVREILATEMLEALGVYTSKTLSLIETGENLERGDEPSPTRSAVMVRLGHSHVRFGVFQRLAAEKRGDSIEKLADYCIDNFYPHLRSEPERTAKLFAEIVAQSARLCAQWMAAGFVHGVLNTDNMNVTGESFDYGPWRFLPVTDFGFTAAYFDQTGLYAYGRQPDAVAWNLAQLGGALSLVVDEEGLNNALQTFPHVFEIAMVGAFFRRLGIKPSGDGNFEFVMALLRWMEEAKVPFEQVMHDLFCYDDARLRQSQISSAYESEGFVAIQKTLADFEAIDAGRLKATYFKNEPETMLIDEVEDIWAAIADDDDWSKLNHKIAAIREMGAAYQFNVSSFPPKP